MKVLYLVVGLYLFSLFIMIAPTFAQNQLLLPVPAEDTKSPTLTISSPEKDSVVTSRVLLQMKVSNFELTAKPVESKMAGVIAIYVDGKFFTNTASSSAQLSLPRVGTHHIEAELTHVDRTPIVPRVSDSLYVHVQKKTPYLRIKNLRPDSNVYTNKSTFSVDYVPASFEDKSSYFQVFIDGEVDGSSKGLEDLSQYTLSTALSEGKHSLRLALYNDNDRPYIPTVDYQVSFNYVAARPEIENVVVPETVTASQPFIYEVITSNFEIGKDGYLDIFAEGVHHYMSENKGSLVGLSAGNQKITYTLYDINGLALNPAVSSQKIVPVSSPKNSSNSVNSLLPQGTFFTPSDGTEPRWGFIILGAIEAIAIVVFGILLLKHEKGK